MSLRIRNTLGPALALRLRALDARQPILVAVGAALVALTQRAFSDSALRPAPWPPRKSLCHPHPLLRDSGALYGSIRVLQATNESVSVGSDLPYAAVHQFGSARRTGRGGGIPARPFFPYDRGGNLTSSASQRVRAAAITQLQQHLRM